MNMAKVHSSVIFLALNANAISKYVSTRSRTYRFLMFGYLAAKPLLSYCFPFQIILVFLYQQLLLQIGCCLRRLASKSSCNCAFW
jgi:hypothetical protein